MLSKTALLGMVLVGSATAFNGGPAALSVKQHYFLKENASTKPSLYPVFGLE